MTDDSTLWSYCEYCGVPVFRHCTWSHQGGTPPLDHEAEPARDAESALYQEWLNADQGCDMTWEEYKVWACSECQQLRDEIREHQFGGIDHPAHIDEGVEPWDVLTVAEHRALDWVGAMQWLDRRGVPGADSLIVRLMMFEAALIDGDEEDIDPWIQDELDRMD